MDTCTTARTKKTKGHAMQRGKPVMMEMQKPVQHRPECHWAFCADTKQN